MSLVPSIAGLFKPKGLVALSAKTPGLSAKALEASGCDPCVVNGVLGIAMPKVILDQL